MPTLPVSTDLTGSAITEAQAKTWFGNLRTFLADLLGTTGTVATALAQLGVIFGTGTVAKSGAYTVIASDRGKTLDCTGTWSLSLTAAATLGDGFSATVVNSGSGVITIDPNASELIDGVTTLALAAGERCVIACTRTAWLSLGRAPAVTPPYRHTPGSAVYLKNDAVVGCAYVTSYESIPGWNHHPSTSTPIPVFQTGRTHNDVCIRIDHPGEVTASFQFKRATASGTAYARICKNGAELQAWSQTSETYATYTVNTTVKVGDVITFQRRSSTTSTATTSSRYHQILITQPT